MSDDARPRSRFDRGDPPPRGRFDRRSRSPSNRDSDSHPRRTRSPIAREPTNSPSTVASPKLDSGAAAAAAAAAAARINAQIQARKSVKHVDVPPIRSTRLSTPTAVRSPSAEKGSGVQNEIYQQDGDYIKDIEVNDLRNRYTLTKGATQKMIKEETGADVTTRGSYYPDKSMATVQNPPLYLHVTATTKEALEQAIAKIEELMGKDLPNLVDERRFRRRETENVERDEFGRRKWPEEKIPVDLEPISGFNLRAQVVGQGGNNVKWVQQETGCKVQIKGRGSGYIEPLTGQESDEPMYLHIAGPRIEGVQRARELCMELLRSVKSSYDAFKERPQHRYNDRYGGENHSGGGQGYGDRGDRDRSSSYGYGSGYGGYGQNDTQSSTSGTSAADLNAQWAAYYQNGGQDPYAAYGGYDAYLQMWQHYYGQGAIPQSPAPGTAGTVPPPPPSEPTTAQPPPPPPAGSPAGSYNAVAPPPGL
ncbi:hypothetical protein CC78DRAFT_575374 [Lojkania enalia]|uniref:K Homology domain-containing protein n=1 Tax=Lojkania enalia TaxID=147567 RepID=A0A9P4TNV7_9PLEO|nr:hypothetical protein CC78DRAFT_575374 [Didymosphaeria enalia]